MSENISKVRIERNDSSFIIDYLYNSQGQQSMETHYFLNDWRWDNYLQKEWTYANGNCIEFVEKKWNNGAWENNFRIQYNYQNNILTSKESSNFSSGSWITVRREENTYLAGALAETTILELKNGLLTQISKTNFTYNNGLLKQTLLETFNENAEPVKYLNKYAYKTNNNLIDTLLTTVYENGNWANFSRSKSLYYSDGTIKSVRVQDWDTVSNYWRNDRKTIFEYDSNGRLENEIYQIWNLQSWKQNYIYINAYDSSDKLIKRTFAQSVYQEWRDVQHIDYYSPNTDNEILIESMSDFWGNNAGNLVDWHIPYYLNDNNAITKASKIIVNYYDRTSNNNLNQMGADLLTVYPNPSDGIFFIDSDKYKIQSWKIFDINGRTIKEQSVDTTHVMIDITNIAAGIYFIQVNTDAGNMQHKIIKK